jgi:hypothetical protein
MEAKRLLSVILVTILAEWVKGHYNGKDRGYKHELNEFAGSLANSFNSSPHPQFIPRIKPIAPLNYGARILHDGSTITNKLRPLMAQSLHRQTLVSHITNKNNGMKAPFT